MLKGKEQHNNHCSVHFFTSSGYSLAYAGDSEFWQLFNILDGFLDRVLGELYATLT